MGQNLGSDDGSVRTSFGFVQDQRLLDALSHSMCAELRYMDGTMEVM